MDGNLLDFDEHDIGALAASSLWYLSCVMMAPGLFLMIQTNFLSADGDSLGLHSDFGKANCFYVVHKGATSCS